MPEERSEQNSRDSSHDSAAREPLYGLLFMGLIVIFLELTALGYNQLFPGSQKSAAHSGRCIYQVFENDFCLGTVFLEHPESIPTILSTLGKNVDYKHNWGDERIPCDRVVNLLSQRPWIAVTKMSGAHLLILGKPIDINLADQVDLDSLPGIGPELARRIVTYREKHGPFHKIGDLERIRGIGKKKRAALQPHLTTGPSSYGDSQ